MLRVAMPNKGALAEPAAEMLREAGYRGRRDAKELVILDADNDVELFFLRPRDIAVYVGQGTLDVGLTGRDLLLDSGSPATECLPLGFGASTFRYAGSAGGVADVAQLEGRRVATSFPGLVRADLRKHGVHAEVVRLDGAVETAVTLGVADVIADVVETGTTLRNAGLEVFGEPILQSEAVLVQRADADSNPLLAVLIRRLQGVLTAQRYVMVDYDIRRELVEQAFAVTPGLESPTVSPLHDEQFVAVRAMVPRRSTNAVMDELYEIGARAILVTEIAACRL
ncbi:ATP phosphoribosyltransferase [Allobranchiibius sp. GilTou38]|uniref:ATP phosphoribosyltransferase n=1 Tax=Allobranchiibius sp. GilTou38 TaxID=2815210 RepID=UPI001AA1B86D|nr:ATP phosphoribosyltransferase [Allobranchiibius sp. GilTou38]MBO1766266.1 ATP phosphoribosyltransferase [Allobranchiibius sp. GilTou38]